MAVTIIEEVVSPVLHNKDPLEPDAVKTELSQLFVTVTTGAGGMYGGRAITVPAGLVHPSTV